MKTRTYLLATILLGWIIGLNSCKEDTVPVGPEGQYYSLGITLGGDYTSYLLTTDDLTEGTISPVGNGVEISSSEYIQAGEYIYFFSRNDKKFFQYKLNTNGSVTEVASLLVTQYITSRAYSQNLVDNNTLLVMDPIQWGEPEIQWFTIKLPEFIIQDYGTYSLPTLEQSAGVNWKSNLGRGALHGDKFIMGTVYYDFDGNTSDGTHAVVLDYPTMTNPTLIETKITSAELGIFTNNNFVSTKSGDLYIVGYRGAYGKMHDDNVHGVLFRIKMGETDFDESYLLDFTQAIGESTQIMQLDFLEGETAMGMLCNDEGLNADNIDSDIYYYARINLSTQEVQPFSMPRSDIRLARKPLVDGGKYISYIKSAENNTTNVLQINYNGEPDDYVLGKSIEGENIQGYSVVKHPAP